jgi:hypothetical protein
MRGCWPIIGGVPPERRASTQGHGRARKIGSESEFFNISKDVSRVKSVLFWFFASFQAHPFICAVALPCSAEVSPRIVGLFRPCRTFALGPF